MSTVLAERQPWERSITWGEALKARLAKQKGGLVGCIVPSQRMVGDDIIGSSHNTWRRLLHIESPDELRGGDMLRAWLLLTTLGETPEEWGIDTKKAVPAGFDQDRLRRELPLLVAGAGFEPATSGLRAGVVVQLPDRPRPVVEHDWYAPVVAIHARRAAA